MMEKKMMSESFEYTYSAKQQEEIEAIRKKYLPKENLSVKESKLEDLRKLDKKAEKPGRIVSLVLGILGTLLLGIGMCCTMVWKEQFFVLGIVIGIVGLLMISTAYPIYKKITAHQRVKMVEQVLALANEISIQI